MALYAGFTDISLRRSDLEIMAGKDADEAVSMVMSIGPAGEILRLQGERAAHLHGQIAAALHEACASSCARTGPSGRPPPPGS